MLKIGITGGIGSGKTTVAKIFELLQVPVYYADAASKRLYETDASLRERIIQEFGKEIYSGNRLNKAALAQIVFSDPAKLALLNSLVHPLTITDARNWMNQQKTTYVLKEAALIFESGSAEGLDYVIGVAAPAALRIHRAMQRDGVSREEVQNRMSRQINEGIKMRLCDFIIHNNEQQLVIPQVLKLHEFLLKKAQEKSMQLL